MATTESSCTRDLDARSVAERIARVERIMLTFPRLERLRGKIEYCHQHSKVAAEPECLLVTGPTGAGKTTLCQTYARGYPRSVGPHGVRVPVLAASIPVPATAKSLVTRLLEALGDPLAERGTAVSQTLRLVRLMRDCGVELIILDEFQHFIDRDSNHILLTVANWLKDVLNETNVPIVLTGMPYSDVILRANAQLERRFGMRERIDPFAWDTPEARTEFRTLLYVLDRALAFDRPSNLSDSETAHRIYCATGGVLGYVMKLVRRAAVFAVERRLDLVDLTLLAEAYDERLAQANPGLPHPFRAGVDELEVRPVGHGELDAKRAGSAGSAADLGSATAQSGPRR